MPENLDLFRRMLVYRGAGLGRFHCIQSDLTYLHTSVLDEIADKVKEMEE